MVYLRFINTLILAAFISFALTAQPAKHSLNINDLAGWNTIEGVSLSNNGAFAAYQLKPLKGNGKLIINQTDGSFSDTIPLGKEAKFTADSRFVVFRFEIPEDSLKEARKKKLEKEKMPLESIGIYRLSDRTIKQFNQLQTIYLPEKQTDWLAFTLRPDSLIKLKDKTYLPDLILYHPVNGDTITIRRVQNVAADKEGNAYLYQTHSADSTNTISLFRFDAHSRKTTLLFSECGSLKNLALSRASNNFAFLFSTDTTKHKKYQLRIGSDKPEIKIVANPDIHGIPANWYPSVHRNLLFSDNNKQLYFGTAPLAENDSTAQITDDEKPRLDLWSWTDKELMPAQLLKKEKELKRNYLAVYHLNEGRGVQLADSLCPEVDFNPKWPGKLVLGENRLPYLCASSWTGRNAKDYYIIDSQTGTKKLIASNESSVQLSPNEKYAFWFEPTDSSFYAFDLVAPNARPVNLTKQITTSFYNEQQDVPAEASPYGVAGWSDSDRFVFVYDRFDIWQLDPSGHSSPRNLTRGFGKKQQISFRYIQTNPDQTTLDDDNWLLSAFDENDKSTGFYRFNLKRAQEPAKLVKGDYLHQFVLKAKDAELLVWTKESCSDFPDLWVSGPGFDNPRKLSNANPQQNNFIWVRRELVSWTSFSGEKLEGILYFPENFNPDSLYPMIVYYYELNSNTLNSYSVPSPSRSIINRSYYPSNGYLVFIPDITYKTGYPGQSAYNAIISGTNTLLNERNYIDPTRLGIQGQSWGGYQTAYLITQTDLFAAAMAGAPVSNMTSAYGGIRWETGMSRMFQYEHTQSRIGGTLWDKPMQYIENSPLFYTPKINTPLLLMHNDNDGAVPWYQGIELFVALRRLDKPVWLLNYNNEPHNLKPESWANRIDLTQRMMQFFDHYLKGATAPRWMTDGLPATEKGKSLGY